MTLPVEQPVITVDGQVQGADMRSKPPQWIKEGAVAAWSLQETSGDFLDEGDNLWDVPRAASITYRHHDLLSRITPNFGGSFGTAAHAAARLTGAMSLALLMRYSYNGEGGIFCYSTGTTDCLWGLGITSNGLLQIRDKRHLSGAAIYSSVPVYASLYGAPVVVIASRAADGSWRLVVDGQVVREIGAAAAPSVVGDEQIVIGGRNEFDHIGLWTRELSLAEARAKTRGVKPWLTF